MASKGKNYVLDTETEKPDEAEEDNSTEEESSDTETPEEDAPEKGDSKSDVSLTDLNDDPVPLLLVQKITTLRDKPNAGSTE